MVSDIRQKDGKKVINRFFHLSSLSHSGLQYPQFCVVRGVFFLVAVEFGTDKDSASHDLLETFIQKNKKAYY